MMADTSQRQLLIRSLAERIRPRPTAIRSEWNTEIPALSDLIAENYAATGALVEWLRDSPETSAELLALQGVRTRLTSRSGLWAVIDRDGSFCPSCLGGWNIPPDRLMVIRPHSDADFWWSAEQFFRCPGIVETWCWVDRMSDTILRR